MDASADPILHRDGRYVEDSEAFAVARAVLAMFYDEAVEAGSTAIILVFPDPRDRVRRANSERSQYEALLRALEPRRVIDLYEAFEHGPPAPVDGLHCTPEANRLIARHVVQYLQRERLDLPGNR